MFRIIKIENQEVGKKFTCVKTVSTFIQANMAVSTLNMEDRINTYKWVKV